MKLKEIKQLKGKILLKTGLHIGAGDTEIHIGGTDSSVVKHPITSMPYIPGSSIKGKMRSLLELSFGLITFTNGNPVSYDTYKKLEEQLDEDNKKSALKILKLFGTSANKNIDTKIGLYTSRLSFSDCFISKDNKANTLYSEIKMENVIDRSTGTTKNGGLRTIERVPEGVLFNFELSIKIFDDDKEEELLEIVKNGLRLLELDSLGGSGSRGYGKIEFTGLSLDGEEFVLPEKPNCLIS